MKSRLYRLRSDEGVTLIELIMTVIIMGILFVAVLGGMMTSAVVSDTHRKQSTAEGLLRSYADAVEASSVPGGVTNTYVPCGGPASYYPGTSSVPASTFSVPAVYSATVLSSPFEYWNSATGQFQTACPAGDGVAQGAQRMWLQVRSTDGRDTEQLQIVKRAP